MFWRLFKARMTQYRDGDGVWHLSTWRHNVLWGGTDYRSSGIPVACGKIKFPVAKRKTSRKPTCQDCAAEVGKVERNEPHDH
jgi:hypothetical protein